MSVSVNHNMTVPSAATDMVFQELKKTLDNLPVARLMNKIQALWEIKQRFKDTRYKFQKGQLTNDSCGIFIRILIDGGRIYSSHKDDEYGLITTSAFAIDIIDNFKNNKYRWREYFEKHWKNPRSWGLEPKPTFFKELERIGFAPNDMIDFYELSNPTILAHSKVNIHGQLMMSRPKKERIDAYLDAWIQVESDQLKQLKKKEAEDMSTTFKMTMHKDYSYLDGVEYLENVTDIPMTKLNQMPVSTVKHIQHMYNEMRKDNSLVGKTYEITANKSQRGIGYSCKELKGSSLESGDAPKKSKATTRIAYLLSAAAISVIAYRAWEYFG